MVAGAGACEIELARQIESYGEKCAGLEQYAIRNYALALEALPKQLADNAGMKVNFYHVFVAIHSFYYYCCFLTFLKQVCNWCFVFIRLFSELLLAKVV